MADEIKPKPRPKRKPAGVAAPGVAAPRKRVPRDPLAPRKRLLKVRGVADYPTLELGADGRVIVRPRVPAAPASPPPPPDPKMFVVFQGKHFVEIRESDEPLEKYSDAVEVRSRHRVTVYNEIYEEPTVVRLESTVWLGGTVLATVPFPAYYRAAVLCKLPMPTRTAAVEIVDPKLKAQLRKKSWRQIRFGDDD